MRSPRTPENCPHCGQKWPAGRQQGGTLLSCLSSSQASYPSPRRERQGSLIPPLLLSPPQPLRWVAAGTPVCAALRPVSAWLLLITAWHIFPLSGPTRPALPQRATQGPTPRFTGWEVHGCHPVYRRATNGLTVRNKGADLREPQRRLSNWVMWLALERRFPEQAG